MRRAVPLLLAAALAAPLATGCSSDSPPSCASVARRVNTQVRALRSAVARPGGERDAAGALRTMQQDLDDIDTQADHGRAADQAIGDLTLAISDVKNELDKDQRPDIRPVVRAASALESACPAKG